MAVEHYKYTLAANSADFHQFLGGSGVANGLYNHFDGPDGNWEIRPATTLPTQVSAAGDQGFVIRDTATSTINIAISVGSEVGGYLVNGTTLASTTTTVVVGICPAGGVSDITGTAVYPTRWSRWTKNAQALTNSAFLTYKIISGPDYLFVRIKNTADSKYTGGFFVGKSLAFGARATGYTCISGLWTEWSYNTINQSTYEYDTTGRWSQLGLGANTRVIAVPPDAHGMDAASASDGAGNYNYNRVVFMDTVGGGYSAAENGIVISACPCLFVGPENDAQAKRWTVAAAVTMVNMTGGSWMCLDDGVNAE